MIRTYIGLPPSPPPPSSPPFPLMPRGCITKASLMFTNASQKYRRSFVDVSPTISVNNQQLLPNVRWTLDYVGDALANIRQTIASQFFHRNSWYLGSKSQGIGKHRVYNYTFHHRRCKNPQWDRGINESWYLFVLKTYFGMGYNVAIVSTRNNSMMSIIVTTIWLLIIGWVVALWVRCN